MATNETGITTRSQEHYQTKPITFKLKEAALIAYLWTKECNMSTKHPSDKKKTLKKNHSSSTNK